MRKRVGLIGFNKKVYPIASKFLKHGYEVMLGTQNKQSSIEWANQSGDNAWLGNYEETARFGDFVVLASRKGIAEFLLDMAGAANLHGKTVIVIYEDTSDINNDVLSFNRFSNLNSSSIEKLQKKYSRVNFVKAFIPNMDLIGIGLESSSDNSTIFLFGNDERAKHNADIAFKTLGWLTNDLGTIEVVLNYESVAV